MIIVKDKCRQQFTVDRSNMYDILRQPVRQAGESAGASKSPAERRKQTQYYFGSFSVLPADSALQYILPALIQEFPGIYMAFAARIQAFAGYSGKSMTS